MLTIKNKTEKVIQCQTKPCGVTCYGLQNIAGTLRQYSARDQNHASKSLLLCFENGLMCT